MRSYPRNSPEAAARIVALVLISDGNVCPTELETLQRLQVDRELGLAPGRFADVLRLLCEDLLASAYGSGASTCSVDPDTLAGLLAEVDAPDLQRKVLQLAAASAAADRHLADGEQQVLLAARERWPQAVIAATGGVVPRMQAEAMAVPA